MLGHWFTVHLFYLILSILLHF